MEHRRKGIQNTDAAGTIKNFLKGITAEITAPHEWDFLKVHYPDYSIMVAANVNMRFTKTNDLLSSNFVADPFGV
jgi:hypothetical protein